jgi:hypothetical protein
MMTRSAAVEPTASDPAAELTAAAYRAMFEKARNEPCPICGGHGLHVCKPAEPSPVPLTAGELCQIRGLLAERATHYRKAVEDETRRVAEFLGLDYTPNQ